MTGDCHVRFWERLGGKVPRPTRLYGAHIRRLNSFFATSDHQISYSFNEEGVGIRYALGTSSLTWNAFTEVMENEEFLLIFYDSAGYLMVPKKSVSPEIVAFIKSRIAA